MEREGTRKNVDIYFTSIQNLFLVGASKEEKKNRFNKISVNEFRGWDVGMLLPERIRRRHGERKWMRHLHEPDCEIKSDIFTRQLHLFFCT